MNVLLRSVYLDELCWAIQLSLPVRKHLWTVPNMKRRVCGAGIKNVEKKQKPPSVSLIRPPILGCFIPNHCSNQQTSDMLTIYRVRKPPLTSRCSSVIFNLRMSLLLLLRSSICISILLCSHCNWMIPLRKSLHATIDFIFCSAEVCPKTSHPPLTADVP